MLKRIQKPFLAGYFISAIFVVWALAKSNYEFVAYAAATIVLLGIIHYFNAEFSFNKFALWGFDFWILLHIFGGLFVYKEKVLYNWIIFPLVSEPYSILKYDQVVHAYCYFIIALLMWSVVAKTSDKASFGALAFITVLAAAGIGSLNEIIEFGTTLFFANNVGGYENTILDIISNLFGALIAAPFFRKI